MKIFSAKNKKKDAPRRQKKDEKVVEKPNLSEGKDPYRWIALVFFLVTLFVSYVFWVQGQ
jgi:hypothetical protein